MYFYPDLARIIIAIVIENANTETAMMVTASHKAATSSFVASNILPIWRFGNITVRPGETDNVPFMSFSFHMLPTSALL